MATEPAGVMSVADARERSEKVWAAIEADHDKIGRAVAAMVRAVERGRDREWIRQRTEEVVAEAVFRALERPGSYDPSRPIDKWVAGIARNVIRGEARAESGRPRRADMDEAAIESVIGIIDKALREAADQMAVERMLSRLSPAQRKAIEARHLRGLEGLELAEAIGAPNAEAARVRVHRAVQALRDLFGQDDSEAAR